MIQTHVMAKAANIIRRDILQTRNFFDGTFAQKCQNNAIPFLSRFAIPNNTLTHNTLINHILRYCSVAKAISHGL